METDMVVENTASQCAFPLALFANKKIQQKPTLFLPSDHIMNLLNHIFIPWSVNTFQQIISAGENSSEVTDFFLTPGNYFQKAFGKCCIL